MLCHCPHAKGVCLLYQHMYRQEKYFEASTFKDTVVCMCVPDSEVDPTTMILFASVHAHQAVHQQEHQETGNAKSRCRSPGVVAEFLTV